MNVWHSCYMFRPTLAIFREVVNKGKNYVRGVQLTIIIIIRVSYMFTVFPKWVLHRVRSGASSFNFQYLVFSLRSSSSCLSLLPRLPVTSILACICPSVTCFRRQFLRKMWSVQLPLPFSLLFVGYSSPWLFVLLLHFSHNRSTWSPSFSIITLQNFPGIYV
jgi:hypothetical protein